MAGQRCIVNSGEVVMVAATPKTILQVKAAANQRVLIRSLRITGKQAAGGTDTPGKLRMTRSTANFGTGTSQTPAKGNPANAETVQTTAASNFTVEPSGPADSMLWWEVQLQGGIIEFLPPGQEIDIPGGNAVNFELTIAGTPTALLTVGFEE